MDAESGGGGKEDTELSENNQLCGSNQSIYKDFDDDGMEIDNINNTHFNADQAMLELQHNAAEAIRKAMEGEIENLKAMVQKLTDESQDMKTTIESQTQQIAELRDENERLSHSLTLGISGILPGNSFGNLTADNPLSSLSPRPVRKKPKGDETNGQTNVSSVDSSSYSNTIILADGTIISPGDEIQNDGSVDASTVTAPTNTKQNTNALTQSKATKAPTNNTNLNATVNNATFESTDAPAAIKTKVTPFIVTASRASQSVLKSELIRHGFASKFTMKMINNKTVKLMPISEEVKNDMKHVLNGKYEYHSFSNRDQRSFTLLIKGLTDDTTADHIRQAFDTVKIKTEKIVQHETGFMRAAKIQPTFWRVTFPTEPEPSKLMQIRYIESVVPIFETMEKKPLTQCRNCQGFFHTAFNCRRKYHCVKCSEEHNPGECTRKRDDNIPAFCWNCKGQHTANDLRNCPTAIAIMEKRSQQIQHKDNLRNQMANSIIVRGKSFADTMRENITANESHVNINDTISIVPNRLNLKANGDPFKEKILKLFNEANQKHIEIRNLITSQWN